MNDDGVSDRLDFLRSFFRLDGVSSRLLRVGLSNDALSESEYTPYSSFDVTGVILLEDMIERDFGVQGTGVDDDVADRTGDFGGDFGVMLVESGCKDGDFGNDNEPIGVGVGITGVSTWCWFGFSGVIWPVEVVGNAGLPMEGDNDSNSRSRRIAGLSGFGVTKFLVVWCRETLFLATRSVFPRCSALYSVSAGAVSSFIGFWSSPPFWETACEEYLSVENASNSSPAAGLRSTASRGAAEVVEVC